LEGLGGSSLGFDILIIFLPFPILRRLQLDMRKKLILGALFALGFFVTVIQIIRIRTIAALVTYTDSEPIIIWSIVEIHLGALISCVPSFAPLLKRFGETVTHGYKMGNSDSHRQRGTKSMDKPHAVELTAQSRSVGKSTTRVTRRVVEDMDEDDEVMLWGASQAVYPSQVQAWKGDTPPPTRGQWRSEKDRSNDGNADGDQPTDRDILVVHEVQVLSE
jgi:hypothetical protein